MDAYLERRVPHDEMVSLMRVCGIGFTASSGPSSRLIPLERGPLPVQEQPYYNSESFNETAASMCLSILTKLIPAELSRQDAGAASLALVRVLGAELVRASQAAGSPNSQMLIQDIADSLKVAMHDELARQALDSTKDSPAPKVVDSAAAAWPTDDEVVRFGGGRPEGTGK
jgi:hypothetical protein